MKHKLIKVFVALLILFFVLLALPFLALGAYIGWTYAAARFGFIKSHEEWEKLEEAIP